MDNKTPNGYISMTELIELSERNADTVRRRLLRAGVKGEYYQLSPLKRIRIFPQREALYAVLDK